MHKKNTRKSAFGARRSIGVRGGSRPLSISFPLRRNPHFSSFFPRFRARSSHKFQQPSLRAIQDSIFPTLGSSGGGIMSFPPFPSPPPFATSTTLFRKVCQELLLPLAPPPSHPALWLRATRRRRQEPQRKKEHRLLLAVIAQ